MRAFPQERVFSFLVHGYLSCCWSREVTAKDSTKPFSQTICRKPSRQRKMPMPSHIKNTKFAIFLTLYPLLDTSFPLFHFFLFIFPSLNTTPIVSFFAHSTFAMQQNYKKLECCVVIQIVSL